MITEIAAVAATVIFGGLTVFQFLLAAGLPLGSAAWGGKHRVLPGNLRISSLVSAGIFIISSILVLEKAGLVEVFGDQAIVKYGVGILAAFFGINAVTNYMSRSRIEKLIMTPTALVLCLLCLTVALTAG